MNLVNEFRLDDDLVHLISLYPGDHVEEFVATQNSPALIKIKRKNFYKNEVSS